MASLILCWVVPAIAAVFSFQGYREETVSVLTHVLNIVGFCSSFFGFMIMVGEFIYLSEFYMSMKLFGLRTAANIIPAILWGFNTAMMFFFMKESFKVGLNGEPLDTVLDTMLTVTGIMGVVMTLVMQLGLFFLVYGMCTADRNSAAKKNQVLDEEGQELFGKGVKA